jgi:hypothetical protein
LAPLWRHFFRTIAALSMPNVSRYLVGSSKSALGRHGYKDGTLVSSSSFLNRLLRLVSVRKSL